MSRVLVTDPASMPSWLRHGAGEFPVPEALTIEEVQQRLAEQRWVEHRCDEVDVPEWVGGSR